MAQLLTKEQIQTRLNRLPPEVRLAVEYYSAILIHSLDHLQREDLDLFFSNQNLTDMAMRSLIESVYRTNASQPQERQMTFEETNQKAMQLACHLNEVLLLGGELFKHHVSSYVKFNKFSRFAKKTVGFGIAAALGAFFG